MFSIGMSKGVDPGVLICLEFIWAGVILYFKTEMEIIFRHLG